jgi:hypothetical protein
VAYLVVGKQIELPFGSFHEIKQMDVMSLHIPALGTAYFKIETVNRFDSTATAIEGSCDSVISALRYKEATINKVVKNWKEKLNNSCL